MDPAELRYLIDRSREIHTALRNPKQRTAAEEPVTVSRAPRSWPTVTCPRAMSSQRPISGPRRPGSGEIAGYDFDKVLGRTTTRALPRNTQLKWSDLDG